MTTFENIPKEVMINILSRVPPEFVFQFMIVSKFWYALINDSVNSFFFQHKHILFMRLQKDSDSQKTQLILSDFALDPSMSIFNDFHLPLPFDWNQSPLPFDDDIDFYENFHIHGHCYGLVCLTDYRRNIVLCNPTTREFRKLPPSIFMLANPSEYIYDGCGNAIGFGYDSKSSDFKVIRIVCYRAQVVYWRAEIFDLSKDRWREVEVPSIDNTEVPSFGVFHQGKLLWMVTFFIGCGTSTIYSFDISEEVFDQIRLPRSLEEKGFEHWSLMDMGVLNESIAIFYYSWQENELETKTMDIWNLESTLDIWKMENSDESGIVSWSKTFTINLNSKLIGRPLMFMNSNQLLTIKEGQVILYDIKSAKLKELPLKGHADVDVYHTSCDATYFVKNMYSLKGENY